jgi:hypothetical protein
MNNKEMKNLIFEMLATVLSGTDFQLKKSEDGFVRKIPGGRQMLGVPLWDYNPEFEFSLNICIRLDSVEDVFHRFSGAPPKYHAMGFSMMTRLQYFTGGTGIYRVKTADDVAVAETVLSAVIRKNVVPFFAANEDVKSLDETVNGSTSGIDITVNPPGAMHAVLLARLAQNLNFEQIILKHRNAMQLPADATHPFNNLVNYLRQM